MKSRKPRQTKTTLEVHCNANHESTLMIRVVTNSPRTLRDRSLDLWCPSCNRTCYVWIGTAAIITKYENDYEECGS